MKLQAVLILLICCLPCFIECLSKATSGPNKACIEKRKYYIRAGRRSDPFVLTSYGGAYQAKFKCDGAFVFKRQSDDKVLCNTAEQTANKGQTFFELDKNGTACIKTSERSLWCGNVAIPNGNCTEGVPYLKAASRGEAAVYNGCGRKVAVLCKDSNPIKKQQKKQKKIDAEATESEQRKSPSLADAGKSKNV